MARSLLKNTNEWVERLEAKKVISGLKTTAEARGKGQEMKTNAGIQTTPRSAAVALVVVMLLSVAFGSAFAFPTPTDNSSIGTVTVINPAEIEQININGSSKSVYMGPYNVPNPSFADYMMCFNAAATALATTSAWATNTTGAAALFGADTRFAFGAEKISMIAWLASQWDFSQPLAAGKNADINKAMWEIMADYDTSKASSGLNIVAGSFYINTGDSDVDDVKKLLGLVAGFDGALQHTIDATAANFLIPIKEVNGLWVYDSDKQPFVQPVPEPGTLLLLGSGLTGLGLFGWRKRARAKR